LLGDDPSAGVGDCAGAAWDVVDIINRLAVLNRLDPIGAIVLKATNQLPRLPSMRFENYR
jgi:hypothetical protein